MTVTRETAESVLTLPAGGIITVAELVGIGAAVLDAVCNVEMLGHASPAATLDYLGREAGWSCADIVTDFVAWTSGRTNMRPGCEERLREYVSTTGWYRATLEHKAKPILAALEARGVSLTGEVDA